MKRNTIQRLPVYAFFAILGILLCSAPCLAVDASFSWLPNTEADLAGYRIHYGTSSQIYDTVVEVGLPAPENDGRIHYTVSGLTPGTTYYFAATAYNTASMESDYSTEVAWTAPEENSGNTAPQASITATPDYGTSPLTVSFDGSGSVDADNDQLSYIWNFGDGGNATSATPYTSHIYTSEGTYQATLQVDDGTALSAAAAVEIHVTPQTSGGAGSTSPKAVITQDKTTGTAPLTIHFDATASTPSTSTGSIVQYAWDFGDGSSGTGATALHTYQANGTYTATLTVTDSNNTQNQATVTITATENSAILPPASSNQGNNAFSHAGVLLQVYKLLLLK